MRKVKILLSRLDGMYANLPFEQFPVFPSAIEIHQFSFLSLTLLFWFFCRTSLFRSKLSWYIECRLVLD